MSSPTSTELPIAKKRGRPKTVNVDKKEYQKKYYEAHKEALLEQKKEYRLEKKDEIKEYQKEYYQNNRESLLEKKKEYIDTLKESNPDKFKEIRDKQLEQSKEIHRKERELFKLFLQLYEKGEMNLPDTHKERINNLLYI